MNKFIEQKLLGDMIMLGISNKTIAKFMSFLKNEYSHLKEYKEYVEVMNELMLCDCCGEVELESNLIDTFGMVNGDFGICCPSCVENGR